MKKILIHSNNTSFNQPKYFSIVEQYVFDVPYDVNDIDIFIDGELRSGKLGELLQSIEVVFIKISLSDNYLEYLGIRLAYHIRLTKSLGEKCCIPIIFIGEESFQFLGITADEPSILFTEGIYLIKENDESFHKMQNWLKNGLIKRLSNFKEFINRINVKAPSNHLSPHSIANEWSILRWAKVLGVSQDDDSIYNIKQHIEGLLYYKFLKCKFPIEDDPDRAKYQIEGKGKILYIDDEWNKGWSVVLSRYLSGFPDIEFMPLKKDFKDKTREKIIDECTESIYSIDPDIVLLDLRLCDADFGINNSKDLTGYKILQKIKGYYKDDNVFFEGINPGIQVLVFTASNKVWNFTEMQIAGADNYIMKESPELSIDKSYTKSALERMASAITNAFKMSFLKKIYLKINSIKHSIGIKDDIKEDDFKVRLNNNLDIAFELLKSTRISLKYFNYSYLQLFQIIEDYCNLSSVFSEEVDSYVFVNGKDACVQKVLKDKVEQPISLTNNGKYEIKYNTFTLQKDKGPKKLDTNFKVSAILIFRYGNPNSSVLKWTEIYTIRNSKAAHFNKENLITEEHIYTLLNFIEYFVCTAIQKDINIEKGLKKKSLDESLEVLKNRFKRL